MYFYEFYLKFMPKECTFRLNLGFMMSDIKILYRFICSPEKYFRENGHPAFKDRMKIKLAIHEKIRRR